MNIYTQVCGLIITILLVYFYLRQPTLGLNSEYRFKHLLYVVLACLLLDIASCITIRYSDYLNVLLVVIIAKLYLVSLSSVAYFALYYTISDVYEQIPFKSPTKIRRLHILLYIIFTTAILYLEIHIYCDSTSLYSYGPACYATYGSVAIYIILTVCETIFHKNYIKKNRIKAIISFISIWIIAAVIQFCFPKLLVVGFASCAGLLIIFFEMENPESSISRRTGHFSSAVIREYINFKYDNRKRFSVMMVSFRTIADSSSDTMRLERTILNLSEFLFSLNDCKIFDTAEGYFLLVFDSPDFIESDKYKINTFLQSIKDDQGMTDSYTLLSPFYTILPDCNIATNAEELLTLLNGFLPTEHKKYDTNEIVVNNDALTNIRKKKQVEDLVIDAIEHNRVEVFFQPIYNVKTGKFSTAEALTRIRLSDGTLLSPAIFIPIVEETGRIIPLSDAIYRKTLSFMKTFHISRLGLEYIEINLSVRQGENPLFASRFTDMLNEYDINPSMINLEITETSSLISRDNILANMNKLKEIGCNFSLDDFGSGSSNLNYIIDMPVKFVKLDRALTNAYFTNDKAKAIIKTVIDMAHSIDIAIIAEGVETQEVLDEMKSLGVDFIQGYLFSPAIPEREFLSFIQEHNLR